MTCDKECRPGERGLFATEVDKAEGHAKTERSLGDPWVHKAYQWYVKPK